MAAPPVLTSAQIEDITAEEHLADVVRIAWKIRVRRSYHVALLVAALAAGSSSYFASPVVNLAQVVRELSTSIFGFAGTVIGILIAGFAILTTLGMSDLVPFLAAIKHKESGLSYLKYTAATFVKVFVPYLAFIAFHAFIAILGWSGGPGTQAAGLIRRALGWDCSRAVNATGMAILAAFFVQLLIVLQAFVFNVYAIFMFMARAKVTLFGGPPTTGQTCATEGNVETSHNLADKPQVQVRDNSGGASHGSIETAVSGLHRAHPRGQR